MFFFALGGRMDQWKPPEGFIQSVAGMRCPSGGFPPPPSEDALLRPCPDSSQKVEFEPKENITARKVQKADREKLRRDRLNEQFIELGNALDPDRPKNDKATILVDTIQILKELADQVNKLKSEYASLSDESRELTQEKNELREEKAVLKSDIDSLTLQYQQRVRAMIPWSTVDASVAMVPPPAYTYHVPLPIPSSPIPVHPTMRPYQFFPPQGAGGVPSTCLPYLSYAAACNPRIDLQPAQRIQSHLQPSSNRSQISCLQDTRTNSDHQSAEKGHDFSNVGTELELKTPGSALPPRSESDHGQDTGRYKGKKEQQWPSKRKGGHVADASSSNKSSSSFSLQDSSSSSVGDGSVAEN